MNTLPNDSSNSSLKGMLYQYYLTLFYCMQMRENEIIYIEKFGDITTEYLQIEVKNYSASLTNLHINFWKTLKNWLNDGFDATKFKNLVLHTTQTISPESEFVDWNQNFDSKKRYEKLLTIKQQFGAQKKKSDEIQKILNFIFEPKRYQKLFDVLSRVIIEASQPTDDDLLRKIKAIHCKHIPITSQEAYLDCLLGRLLAPTIYKNSCITFDDFKQTVEDASSRYGLQPISFPIVKSNEVSDSAKTNQLDKPFVKKIQGIAYHEVVFDAITDYLRTQTNIGRDFSTHTSTLEALNAYQQDIENKFKSKYRQHSRNANIENIFDDSKNFYDETTDAPVESFVTYNNTQRYFRNGLLHDVLNENHDLQWLLQKENSNE